LKVYEELSEKVFVGDSRVTDVEGRAAFGEFLERLKVVSNSSFPLSFLSHHSL
jgi:hypothetical protein